MSWLSDLFGGKKSKEQATQIVQTPTLSAAPEYSLYKKTLEDRMAGLGTGFDQSVLNAATNPYAAQVRTNFQQNTVPAIGAAASARGLGRSTIPINEISRGSQGVEQDIGTKIANLQLANEQEKAAEKTGAISGYGGLLGADYGSIVNNVASQNMQNAEAARGQNLDNQRAMEQAAGGLGAGLNLVQAASPLLNMVLPGVGSAISAGAGILGGGTQNQSATQSAKVNTSGSNSDLVSQLMKLLGMGV